MSTLGIPNQYIFCRTGLPAKGRDKSGQIDKTMATVLLTGGNGLIGRYLCRRLQDRGYDAAILSRTKKTRSAVPVYTLDPEKMEMDPESIVTADYIVHLAGAGIGEKRWTVRRKQEIINSRVSPDKIKQAGYSFVFPTLEDALKDLICKDPA